MSKVSFKEDFLKEHHMCCSARWILGCQQWILEQFYLSYLVRFSEECLSFEVGSPLLK